MGEDAAQKGKDTYAKERQAYEAKYGKIPVKKRTDKAAKAAAKKKKADTPKRPPSAYNLFFKEQFESARQEVGAAAKVTEVSKVVGARWKALTEGGKDRYVKLAAAAKSTAGK